MTVRDYDACAAEAAAEHTYEKLYERGQRMQHDNDDEHLCAFRDKLCEALGLFAPNLKNTHTIGRIIIWIVLYQRANQCVQSLNLVLQYELSARQALNR